MNSLQSAELVAPPVVGGLGDLQRPAHVGDVFALAQQSIGLAKFAHDLLGGVPLACRHGHRAFLPTPWAARLSHSRTEIMGSGQPDPAPGGETTLVRVEAD